MSGNRPRRSWAERWIAVVTRLYPRRFREEFGQEMQGVLRSDHRRHRSAGRAPRFWLRALVDTLRRAPREHLSDLGLDLRYALRALRRRPLFLLVAVLSMGIAIGAAITVVATLDAIFLRPLAGIADQDRLVNLKPWSAAQESFESASYPEVRELRRASSELEDLAGFNGAVLTTRRAAGDEPELHFGQFATANYLSVLGVEPLLGRGLDDDDERRATPVVFVSHWFWQNRLGGETPPPDLWVNGERLSVVGVGPPGFRGNFKGFDSHLFLSLGMGRLVALPGLEERTSGFLELVGRLAPGASVESARAEAAGLERLLQESRPGVEGLELHVEPMTGVDADFRAGLLAFLLILLAITLLILGIACLNVAGMMASRAVERSTEAAVRRALGAPRHRLLRAVAMETLLVGGLAAAVGLGLGVWTTRLAADAFGAVDSRIHLDIRLDGTALVAAVVMALFIGLLALAASGLGRVPRGALAGNRGAVGRRQGWRRALVVGQVVLSFVVLVTAALFLRALDRAAALDLGFDPRPVATATLSPPLAQMSEEETADLFRRIPGELVGRSGIRHAALATRVPLSLGTRFFPNRIAVSVPGQTPPPGSDGFQVEHAAVSAGYFDTLGIEILAGRPFLVSDDDSATAVTIVNQRFAERFFGGDAVGREISVAEETHRIVGVARDARYRTPDEALAPFLYLALPQRSPRRAVLLARADGPPAAVLPEIRTVQLALAPDLPVQELQPLDERLAASLLPQRIGAAAAGGLGGLGLFLSAIGLAGVLGQWVSSRHREIGLRVSLGASPRGVLELVARQGLGLVLLGVLLGAPLAVAASRGLSGFLYGLSPVEPTAYLSTLAVLALAAGIAIAVPALRALRVDPLEALRAE